MAQRSQIIATSTITYELPDHRIDASVDEDQNGGRTTFNAADDIPPMITVISDDPIIKTWSNFGTLSFNHDTVVDREELFEWVKAGEKTTLDFVPIDGTFSYEWQGLALVGLYKEDEIDGTTVIEETLTTPKIILVGKSLYCPDGAVTGIMKCTYKVKAKIYALNDGKDTTLCVFYNKWNNAYTSVTFEGDESRFKRVRIRVKDFCSGFVQEGAEVFIDGTSVGLTEPDGTIDIGLRQVGKSYDIKIKKSGYVDSDKDNILNDSFTIE